MLTEIIPLRWRDKKKAAKEYTMNEIELTREKSRQIKELIATGTIVVEGKVKVYAKTL